jgi:hypothetical protein
MESIDCTYSTELMTEFVCKYKHECCVRFGFLPP